MERVLQELRDLGEIEFLERGSYRVTLKSSDGEIRGEMEKSIEAGPEPKIDEPVIGDGPESVYVYYYPAYKKLAKLLGKSSWPCKIGRTVGRVTERVIGQGTALPERPRLAIVWKTDRSEVWEQALHNILMSYGKDMPEAPGKEWFNTTPEAIVEIIRFLLNASPTPR